MRFKPSRPWLIPLSVLIAATIVPAVMGAGFHDSQVVLVAPEKPTVTMSWCSMQPGCTEPSIQRQIVAWPAHGDLTWSSGNELQYQPRESFWKLGTDSFTFRYSMPGSSPSFATIALHAGHYGKFRRIEEGFEGQDVGGLSGAAFVVPDAAIAGERGLRVVDNNLAGSGAFTFENNGLDPVDLCADTAHRCAWGDSGAQGGNDTLKLRLPPVGNPDPFSGFHQPAGSVVFYALERAPGDGIADILLIPGETGWSVQARLYRGTAIEVTDPFALMGLEPELRLDWWSSAPGVREGGLRLWVDGAVAGSITNIDEWHVEQARRRIGVMPTHSNIDLLALDIDDLSLKSAAVSSAAFMPLLQEGFEQGLGAWDTSAGPNLRVSEPAGLIGDQGLEVAPLAGYDGYFLDPSPANSRHFGVRFRMAAGGLSMVPQTGLRLLALSASNAPDPIHDQVRLQLLETPGGNHEILLQARSGDTAWQSSPAIPLFDGTSLVEITWRAADDGAANGRMELWVDGVLRDQAVGLDNPGAAIESVRLGAWDVAAGASGELYLDAFESWSGVPSE